MIFIRLKRHIAIILAVFVFMNTGIDSISAQNKGKGKKGNTTATVKKKTTTTPKKKSTTSTPKKESINDVKQQQGAVQKEIAATKSKLKENEQAVKKGLAELNVLQGEIETGKKKLAEASLQVKTLSDKIT